ncbi:MAG: helix-turn-helix domain-containing protein [Alphaproteobacteria bacterium]|nr:helix-turn-helix domain-containing protein [Alphaproteobacteria bacterium]
MISPEQIRAARAIINAKQSELAEAAGISLATLNNIERGLGDPRTSTLQAIHDALGKAGIEFSDDIQSESVIFHKFHRPSSYDSFSASKRALESIARDPLLNINSVVFYVRQNINSTGDADDDGHRVSLLLNGGVRKILFDQVNFRLSTSARVAEVAGVLLASLVTYPGNVFYIPRMLEDTTLNDTAETVNFILSTDLKPFKTPSHFFSILYDWDKHFGPMLDIPNHPLKNLIQYLERHPTS